MTRRVLEPGERTIVTARNGAGSLVAPTAGLVVALGVSIGVLAVATVLPTGARHIVAAAVLGAGALWWIKRYVAFRAQSVVLSTERVLVVSGVVARHLDQVRLDRIVEIHVRQRARDRIVGRGDLIVDLVDGPSVVIPGVPHPGAFSRLVLRQISEDQGVPAGDVASSRPEPAQPSSTAPVAPTYRVVTELDPTPPRGTRAISGSAAARIDARLQEIADLEATGRLSAFEADRRRAELLGSA